MSYDYENENKCKQKQKKIIRKLQEESVRALQTKFFSETNFL